MTKNQLNAYLAAILTTALETEPDPFPEFTAYLALGCNILKWSTVREMLTSSLMVTISNNSISLTDKGRKLARKCQASLQGVE